jgi:glycosyl transferase family 87
VSDSSADSQHRSVRLAWIAIGIYLCALGISAVLRTQGDFDVYYRTGMRVLHGEAIYRLDEGSHFLYAPIFAIIFAPFAALPLHAAQFAWYLVCAASLIALILGSHRMLLGRECRPTAALLVIPLILCAVFVNNNIEHGQINLPTLALVVWSIVFAEEDRAAISGCALATAILIKPFAALAALFLLLEGRWRPIAFSAVFAIVLLVAPVVVFGPRGTLAETTAYLQVVGSMSGRYMTMLTNQSATSAVARLMTLGTGGGVPCAQMAIYLGTAIELVLILAVLAWFLRDPDDHPLARHRSHRFQLAALFCIMPSLVPISWKSYYAALLVPYMLLTLVLWTDRPPASPTPTLTLALVTISAILNWIPGKRASHIALFFSAHFISSLVLLAAMATAGSWWQNSAQCRLTPSGTVNN